MGLVVLASIPKVSTPISIAADIHIPNKVCTEGSSSSNYEKDLSIDSSIYDILSMQSDMKTVQLSDRVRNEWDLFLYTGSKKHNDEVYTLAFNILDEYLGSLGVTNGIC